MTKQVVSSRSFVDPSKAGRTAPAGTRQVYQGTKDAEWTCSSCGHTGIKGNVKSCPQCGANKEGDEVYQPPSTPAPFLTAVELAERSVDPTLHESDAVCPYCSAHIKPGSKTCPHCGGTIIADPEPTPAPRRTPIYESEPAASLMGTIPWTPILIGLAVFLLISGLAFALWPRQEQATVTAVHWTSTVQIQEYQYVVDGGWSLPPGADLIGTESRIHHYDQVYDHTDRECHNEQQSDGYESVCSTEEKCETHSVYDHSTEVCYDDGTCDTTDHYRDVESCHDEQVCRQEPKYKDVEVCQDVKKYRDEPRYATWYNFNIWKWVSVAPVSISGDSTDNFRYPDDLGLSDKRREAGRSATFDVTFQVDSKDSYHYTPANADEFGRCTIGSKWVITRNGPAVTKVEPLGK